MMYNRKRIMILLAAMVTSISAVAQQSLQDGIKMYNYEKFQAAERILTPLAATDAMANYYLGLCYIQDGDLAKAGATFTKYPEDFANASGNARVAFANKESGKGMQMVKDLAAKSRKKEWQAEKYAADAITYSQGGDYQQAVTWYKDVLTKTDDASTHIGLADALRKIPGGGGDAMNNYESVTEKDAKNSLAFTRIGDLWYEAKNYESALDNYGKAKDADNTNPLPYKSLAKAYASSGRYKLALENLQKYLQLSDNTPKDKFEYLESLFLAQSYCDAAKLAKEIFNTINDPKQKTELYGILGFAEAQCGDSIDAVKNIRVYIQRQEPSKILPTDYVNYGKLFMKLGMLDSAVFYYNKGIAGDTSQNKTDIYRQIAEAFKTKKDYCNSAKWYDNLIKANPETQPLDYAWRGIMYYYCTDYTKATDAFNAFGAKYPDQPSVPYWQGRTAAAIDSEATTGAAVPYFMKWFDKVGPNYEKKNELKGAYEYLLYYFYNKKDKENMNIYKEKIKAIDPNDKALQTLEEIEKNANALKKQPVKGKK